MANVPSDLQYITIEETQVDQPLTEATIQKIAGNINFVISDLNKKFVYAGAGTYFFTVPEGIRRVFVLGFGGGGGGAWGSGVQDGGGGGGDYGMFPLECEAGETITIVVGAGGAGGVDASGGSAQDGQRGGDTVVTSSYQALRFRGAFGGQDSETPSGIGYPNGGFSGYGPINGAAGGGIKNEGHAPDYNFADRRLSDTFWASGGNNSGLKTRGGGGAGFGNGGNAASISNTNGGDGGYGAGGGCGSGGSGRRGGNGGDGIVIITW